MNFIAHCWLLTHLSVKQSYIFFGHFIILTLHKEFSEVSEDAPKQANLARFN